MVRGKVRRYSTEEGWGIIDSPDTPGGCVIQSPTVIDDPQLLTEGGSVEFQWQPLVNGKNDFRYYATSVSTVGSRPSFAGASWTIDPTVSPDDRMAAFWCEADDTDPLRMRIQMDQLLFIAAYSDARAVFERASLEDFLGDESAAVPLYEASLTGGLDTDRENQARIQLASSLRNVGRLHDALQVLQDFEFSNDYASARDAFAALIRWDLGEGSRALKTALQAAEPALGRYRRAIKAYAVELSDDERK
ncbi:tetratricopeptide repeat protein [Rhodococcus sp. AW25M09]|uniref:tetratricopeptide repeat protein n=1 Tax=Rhodococcus sp. AW25M09 TaxID=1268303 RepID=UPI000348B098|nr:tetratricopeptide repeat protein [Rhodococcus sp. AW25M09]